MTQRTRCLSMLRDDFSILEFYTFVVFRTRQDKIHHDDNTGLDYHSLIKKNILIVKRLSIFKAFHHAHPQRR